VPQDESKEGVHDEKGKSKIGENVIRGDGSSPVIAECSEHDKVLLSDNDNKPNEKSYRERCRESFQDECSKDGND